MVLENNSNNQTLELKNYIKEKNEKFSKENFGFIDQMKEKILSEIRPVLKTIGDMEFYTYKKIKNIEESFSKIKKSEHDYWKKVDENLVNEREREKNSEIYNDNDEEHNNNENENDIDNANEKNENYNLNHTNIIQNYSKNKKGKKKNLRNAAAGEPDVEVDDLRNFSNEKKKENDNKIKKTNIEKLMDTEIEKSKILNANFANKNNLEKISYIDP